MMLVVLLVAIIIVKIITFVLYKIRFILPKWFVCDVCNWHFHISKRQHRTECCSEYKCYVCGKDVLRGKDVY